MQGLASSLTNCAPVANSNALIAAFGEVPKPVLERPAAQAQVRPSAPLMAYSPGCSGVECPGATKLDVLTRDEPGDGGDEILYQPVVQ